MFNIVNITCCCLIDTSLVYFQLAAQLVLVPLYVSAVNRNHIQGATSVEGMYSVLKGRQI